MCDSFCKEEEEMSSGNFLVPLIVLSRFMNIFKETVNAGCRSFSVSEHRSTLLMLGRYENSAV